MNNYQQNKITPSNVKIMNDLALNDKIITKKYILY